MAFDESGRATPRAFQDELAKLFGGPEVPETTGPPITEEQCENFRRRIGGLRKESKPLTSEDRRALMEEYLARY